MSTVKRLLVRLAAITAAMLGISKYLPTLLTMKSLNGALVAAALLTLANATLRPLLLFVTKPLNFLTIGFFTLVVDAVILEIVSAVSAPELMTRGFLNSIAAAFIIGLVGATAVSLFAGGE